MKNIFLLDMDETLLDFSKLERTVVTRLLTKRNCPDSAWGAKRFHEINDSLWKALERGEIERERILTKRFELLYEELGITADPHKDAYTYFSGLENECYPFEGVLDFLKELSLRGRVYICTNGAANVQWRHIRDAGFTPYLTDVFISGELGANKPSEAYVNAVIAKIPDYDGRRAVYLGDSLTADMPCAEKMGASFVLYRRTPPENFPYSVAENYAQVLEIFENL